jgi:hypothetical protein
MRRYVPALMLAVCCAAPRLAAQISVQVHVVATDPAPEATLGRDDPFSVRIDFTTSAPVRLWVRPYYDGKLVAGATTNGSPERSGTGTALGWFSFSKPAFVDEVRVLAGGGTPYHEWEVARYPVAAYWNGVAGHRRAVAPWVTRLRAADRAAERRAVREAESKPLSPGEQALFSGFMLVVLALLAATFIAPIWALRTWRGGWRVAAGVPAVLMLGVVVNIGIGVVLDPSSHNLWPFEVLMSGIVGLGVLSVLAVMRRIKGVGRG